MNRSESVADSGAAAQLQCTGTTQMGAPCRSFVPAGRMLCLAHDPDPRRSKLATAGELLKFTAGVIQETHERVIAPVEEAYGAALRGETVGRLSSRPGTLTCWWSEMPCDLPGS